MTTYVLSKLFQFTFAKELTFVHLSQRMDCLDRHTHADTCPPVSVDKTSRHKDKGKGFPYSLASVWPGADLGVQAVSPQVTISHPPGGRLPLYSARRAVTFPAAQHDRSLEGMKLYCLVTEAHRCEQLAQGCYAAFAPSRI